MDVDVSCGHVKGGHNALIARSLEGVQTCPLPGRSTDSKTSILAEPAGSRTSAG
jgi:hypothetical protein